MSGIRKATFAMLVVVVIASVVATGERSQAESLTVGAAYSLRPVFHEIVPMFEREYGATVSVVYGPSQTLRREIENGSPIDVFLPASVAEVEKLEKKGLTRNRRARIYAQTSLVLVMSATSKATPTSFRDVVPNPMTRIALGDPKASALGEITARALTKLDPAHKNRFQLLHAQHSEEIMDLVRTGEADAGIVYRADAINSGNVRIIDENPAGTHTPVYFGEAVVWTCREASLVVADEFVDFMMSPRIQKLLLKYGFDSAPSFGTQTALSIGHKP